MALLRLLCFSPIPHSSKPPQLTTQKPQHNPNSTLILPNSPFPNSNYLLKAHRPNFLVLKVSSTSTQTQATIDAPEDDEDLDYEEEEEGSRTRVLAQNVPWTCTQDDIRPLFDKFGTVVDIELSMYSKTKNRGLAFVSMSTHEEAVAALNNLESFKLEGRPLYLTWAKPRKKKIPVQPKPVPIHNIFVANLPFQARAKDLKEFFNAENANAVSAEVIFHENPRASAGYGFVSFNTKEEADAALTAFQGKVFMGRSIRVAPSRKFLRLSTKSSIQSEDASSQTDSETQQ